MCPEIPRNTEKLVAALHTRFGDALQARTSMELALQTLQPEGTTAEEYQEYFGKVNYYRNQLVACGENMDTASTTAYTKLQSFAPQHAMREFYHELARSGVNPPITEKYEMLLKWLTLKIQSYCVRSLSELDRQPTAETTPLPTVVEHEANNGIFPASIMMAPQNNTQRDTETRKKSSPWVDRRSNYPERNAPYPRYKGGSYAKYPSGFRNKITENQKFFKCVFHESDEHYARECPFSLAERIAALMKTKRCKNCCFKGHIKDNCPSRKICRNCRLNGVKSRHNTLICPFKPHPELWAGRFQRKSTSDQNQPKQVALVPEKGKKKDKGNPVPAGVNLEDSCFRLETLTTQDVQDDEKAEDAADTEKHFESTDVNMTEVVESSSDSSDSD